MTKKKAPGPLPTAPGAEQSPDESLTTHRPASLPRIADLSPGEEYRENRTLAREAADTPKGRDAQAWLDARSKKLDAELRASVLKRYERPPRAAFGAPQSPYPVPSGLQGSPRERLHPSMASALTCDAEILLEAIREAGVMAFVDGSPVLETVHMWRLAAWWPFCTPAERKEARARLKAIGGALAGRVRGRDTSADTERTRAFVDEYLPILREHLLLLRAGDFDPKAKGRPAAERWRYRQLRDAKFPARDLTRRASDARGSAYAIMARRLGCDERHVRRLARA